MKAGYKGLFVDDKCGEIVVHGARAWPMAWIKHGFSQFYDIDAILKTTKTTIRERKKERYINVF